MHFEIYFIEVELALTKNKEEIVLCFEVGETEEDREELVAKLQKEIFIKVKQQPYKILGFVSKKIYPRES